MTTFLIACGAIALVVFLFRVILWYAIRYDDAHDEHPDSIEVIEAPKFVERHRDSPEATTTGIVPGGVSYIQVPQAGGALIPKPRKRLGRHQK